MTASVERDDRLSRRFILNLPLRHSLAFEQRPPLAPNLQLQVLLCLQTIIEPESCWSCLVQAGGIFSSAPGNTAASVFISCSR